MFGYNRLLNRIDSLEYLIIKLTDQFELMNKKMDEMHSVICEAMPPKEIKPKAKKKMKVKVKDSQ